MSAPLPFVRRYGRFASMPAISIQELHEDTDVWVRKAAQEPVILTDKGQVVAKIVPVSPQPKGNPFLTRELLPGFAELQAKLSGGTDSAQIISEMRDGR